MKTPFLILLAMGLSLGAYAEHGGGGTGGSTGGGAPVATTGPCGVSIGAKAMDDDGPTFGLRAKKTGCSIIIAPEKYEKVDDWYAKHKSSLSPQGWEDASDATVAFIKKDLCARIGQGPPECSADSFKISISGGSINLLFDDGPTYAYHP